MEYAHVYWGIVLRTSNDTAGAFERVGVVSACCDWYGGAQIQEVVLVWLGVVPNWYIFDRETACGFDS